MEEIKRQVLRAQSRLVLQQFLGVVVWMLFAAMLISLAALAIPKIWVLNVDAAVWTWSWIGGSLATALVAAMLWTWVVRRGAVEAAIEIDHRFGLKERVSSALSLTPSDLDTEAGRALMNDTSQRVRRIDVRDRFGIAVNWRALLPLLPAAAVFALAFFVSDAAQRQTANASTSPVATAKQFKESTKALKKKLAMKRKEAQEKGLKDAEIAFDKLHRELDKLHNKNKLDRKDALIKLNNLKKELEDRKSKLGNADQIRKQLNQLKNLRPGPADKMAKAIQDGNFKKAVEELKKLQEKLKNNQLDKEGREQLAKQMQQMQEKLQQMADAHQQAKKELEGRIEQLKKSGDLNQAGKLQRQLDKLQQQNQQMSRMQKMADKLGQCKNSLQQGKGGQAAQQLADAASQLQEMQSELDQLESIDAETLDQMMEQISQAKNAMDCKQCQGKGCGT